MIFPHTLFRQAGLNTTDVAAICDVSRVTGARWLSGAGVNVLLQDRVAKIVSSVEAAVDAGALPDPDIAALPPAKRRTRIKALLSKHRAK